MDLCVTLLSLGSFPGAQVTFPLLPVLFHSPVMCGLLVHAHLEGCRGFRTGLDLFHEPGGQHSWKTTPGAGWKGKGLVAGSDPQVSFSLLLLLI